MLKHNKPKPLKTTKKAACKQIDLRFQSDSDTEEAVTALSMVDSGDEELGATTLGPNDCVIVKFASKKAIRHYVGMIVKPTDESAGEF